MLLRNPRFPIGVQSFEKIRTEGYLYIDKTGYIRQLLDLGSIFFLSRPRRFGKSLFLSTLDSFFRGKRELFNGLDISATEQRWESFPVLHIDFNAKEYRHEEELSEILESHLREWEEVYGKDINEKYPEDRFRGLIRRANEKTGKNVVVLIDEYDKPLLNSHEWPEVQDRLRGRLKAFFGVLKSMDYLIHFIMVTGVTKFGKVSVFSDLNNLYDISLDDSFNAICGITDEELEHHLHRQVRELSVALDQSPEDVRLRLQTMYDGYHFSKKREGVYNPFSLLSALASKRIDEYWFSTGTPTFLIQALKNQAFYLPELQGIASTGPRLRDIGEWTDDIVPLLYQTGYLTIKDFDSCFNEYHLDYPNEEVKRGFTEQVWPIYTNTKATELKSRFDSRKFTRLLMEGKPDEFMTLLKALFANYPYQLTAKLELHFQNVMYLLCTLMGFIVKAEEQTSDGRIDMTVETNKFIYIFEFKINSSPKKALLQIKEKGYADKFAGVQQRIYKIGANFSTKSRRLTGWEIE